MSRASFRQADLQRIMRAAKKTASTVQVDLRSLIVTILPHGAPAEALCDPTAGLKPDREENINGDRNPFHHTDAPPDPIRPPLERKEHDAMTRLVALGLDVSISQGELPRFGPHTQKSLLERGYIR